MMACSSGIVLGPSVIPLGMAAQLAGIADKARAKSGPKPDPTSKDGIIRSVIPAHYVRAEVIVAELRKQNLIGDMTAKYVSQRLHKMADFGRIERFRGSEGRPALWRLPA